MDRGDTSEREKDLATSLAALVEQIDISDYRDPMGHTAKNTLAFVKAQAIVDEYRVTHEDICRALDGCGDDLAEAARAIWARRSQHTPAEDEGPAANLNASNDV